jgi:hypothetical protein
MGKTKGGRKYAASSVGESQGQVGENAQELNATKTVW